MTTPASLPLTGWWRASYTGVPWVGTASAGLSVSRPLVALASFDPPIPGPPENGLTPAAWTTIDQALDAGLPMGSFVSASAWSFSALVYVDGTLAVGFETLIASDVDEYWGVGILNAADHSGFVIDVFQWIGDDQYVDLVIPIPVNQWVEIQASYDGANISGRVNNGAWTSIAAPDIVDLDLATNMLIGAPTLTAFNGGRIIDLMVSDTSFAHSDFGDISSYYFSLYDLPQIATGDSATLVGDDDAILP